MAEQRIHGLSVTKMRPSGTVVSEDKKYTPLTCTFSPLEIMMWSLTGMTPVVRWIEKSEEG